MYAIKTLVLLLSLAILQDHVYGAPRNKIIGGENAPPGKYPYSASLQNNGFHFCGGSILTPKTILTATHCLSGDPRRYSAYVGSVSTQTGGVLYQVEDYVLNPDYDPVRFIHDTAVIYVVGEITFTPEIQPIQIGSEFVEGGEDVVIAGWGMTSYPFRSESLQFIDLKTITHEACESRYDTINFPIDRSLLCTLTRSGEGICFGDSGSAIVKDGKAIGVAALVMPCAIGWPDGFARTSSDYDWLVSVTK